MRVIVIAVAILLMPWNCSKHIMAFEPFHQDVEYASIDGIPLLLDIYQPEARENSPLIVWIHGGAWRAGSKNSVPIKSLADLGFAIASVEYRLSPIAEFPAQVHDIKAAIRFLRANADRYQLDSQNFSIAGASAGGHLAALVGVTNNVDVLEGTIGDDLAESSDVHRIISFYGASNLETILAQSTPHGLSVRVPALELLLGGQPDAKPDLARLASPVTHVDATAPPLLLIHGDQDPQMPVNQSHELHGKYKLKRLPCDLEILHGAAHGGKEFYKTDILNRVADWLNGKDWPSP